MIARFLARLIRGSAVVDRGAQRFDQLRSLLVLAFASDRLLHQYNELAFSGTSAFRPDSAGFREGLFHWEQSLVERFLPAAPADVLVGGAGGGREPFALAAMGYRVVAFDPARPLVAMMRARAAREFPDAIEAYDGIYADLPMLRGPSPAEAIDLRLRSPFQAGVLGWASFSHLTGDDERVAALAAMAALVNGPLVVSYFAANAAPGGHGGGILGALRRRAHRRGRAIFAPAIGFARLLEEGEIEQFAARAGLAVQFEDALNAWPHAVLVRRDAPQASGTGGTGGR